METIGFLELNSIAKGVEAADVILKAAQTSLIYAKTSCPGKYQILFSGEVAAVTSSMEVGKSIGSDFVVDAIIIPRVHSEVIKAINISSEVREVNAVGIMEFFTVAASIYAADTAVKAADVHLIEVRLGMGIGGKSFVVLSGDISAVKEAIEAGTLNPITAGMLVSKVMIPNPSDELFQSLL